MKNLIDFFPQRYIIDAIRFNLGLKFTILTYIKFYKNKIPVFKWKYLNPSIIIRGTLRNYKSTKNFKKYLVR